MQSPPVKEEEGESQSQKTTPFTCPYTVTLRRNPVRKARPTPRHAAVPFDTHQADAISEFPIDDVLSIELPPSKEIVGDDSCSGESQLSEDLKVFIRIRPLKGKLGGEKSVSKDGDLRLKRNAWPKSKRERDADAAKDKKLMSSAVSCIVVNEDSRSVTVSPPFAQQDARRTKSEVYEGFSKVFTPESSQEQVYDTMVKPLVEDFMKGKSGMLVAMGPSGSGKTHTVFGCPRDPGMVPLALRQIFQPNAKGHSTLSRSFYITIFEISSERGKGERILDLLTDGAEVSIYQSTIKGLKKMVISNVAHAESVIAFAMLKRSTAITKANSQSSRSQCIINIHLDTKKIEGESGALSNSAVLTIIDLAGAERSKRIGIQGKQLGESNFINNTSMVFGLCLRSLFEHQKNPKKPLQKHFQSSLLTRYLRDYLEGKKRMSLIITVKSEEDDYTDTSFVLRQASPYMQIKFTGTAQPDLSGAKRHSQALARSDQAKRVKISNYAGSKGDRKGNEVESDHQLDEEATVIEKIEEPLHQSAQVEPLGIKEREKNDDAHCNFKELQRSSQIMQNFAKAIWNVLKKYKSKLKDAENEIESLRENLDFEKTKRLELEKEIQYLKTNCRCSKKISADSDLVHVDAYLEFSAETSQKNVDSFCINEESNSNPTDNLICDTSQSIGSAREIDSSEGQNLEACLQFQSVCDARFIVTNTVGESRMDESLRESSYCCDYYSSSSVDSIRDKEQVTTAPHSNELDETEEHENAQQSDTHVLLGYTSPDRSGSTNIENDKIMEPTLAITDGCCYLLEASHDKHDQKTERSTELVDSESIKNDQLPYASVSTSNMANKFCSLLGSSQKKHEQVTTAPHSNELDETEEHENAQQSDTHVLLGYTSPDRSGSTNIENDKIMEPTLAITDGCCYLLGASHDKHDQKTERSTELVDSESIKNEQLPYASVSTSNVANKFCSLLGSSQKKHEQKIEGFPGKNTEQSSEVPTLAVSYPSSVKIRGDSPQSKTGKPMQHSNENKVTTAPHSNELDETEEHENAQQSDTHVLLGYTSPDRSGSTNIENDKIMEPTLAITDGCCYLLGASHDKHDQKTERSTELVDSESIKNDQLPYASVSTSNVAKKFCSLLGSSQKKHEQKIEGFPGKNTEQSSEVPTLAVSYPSSVKIRGDSPQSKTGKPMQHSNENKEILSKKQLTQKDDKCDNILTGNDDIQKKNTKPSSPRLCDAKPKRRLMPASTALLRDMRVLDLEDESDNRSKGNRGRNKTDTEENQRTQGSINLLRILKSNLHR
ncbi:unnamed protein product [Rhodiola kirilowii]